MTAMTEHKLVGDYELVAQLASGGMAETHIARSLVDDSIVVIKRLLPRYIDNPEFVEMFEDEARVISVLHHPNVVEMREFGFHEGVPYIAMEYLHGIDLRTLNRTLVLRRKRSMPLDVALFIAGAMCAGLHHAHEARTIDRKPMDITHRDVSPQNVMLTFDGAVKLIDFGIATARGRSHETRSGALKGKIPYMAPEQVRAGLTDRRTDVYATGVVLYEMLTGRRPYVGVPARMGEFSLMMAIVNHNLVDPESLRGDLPPGLASIVMRALELEPERRFQTAADLGLALHEVARQLATRPAAAPLAALILEAIGPRKPGGEARSAAEMIELVSEVEVVKTSVDERHDPRTVDLSERSRPATGSRRPEPERGERASVTDERPPVFDDAVVERGHDPAAPPIDKIVRADRTVLRLLRAVPPAFRWSRLFDGIEGVVEIDFGVIELGDPALAAAAEALAGLGREVTAVRLIAAPIALITRADERCTIVSVACRGRCPVCTDHISAVLDYDELQQRLASGAEIPCPRCGHGLVDLALAALPLPAPALQGDLAPAPRTASSAMGSVGSPLATAPSVTIPVVRRSRLAIYALALGTVAMGAAGWLVVRARRGPLELPAAVQDQGGHKVWRNDGRWIAEVEADGTDEADAAMRCHVRAVGAAIAEIEAGLPPSIRALCADRVRLETEPPHISLARSRLVVTRRNAVVHASASYTVAVDQLARAISFYAAIKAIWGIELVNAPPSCGPGVLVLTAPSGPLAVGDRIRSAGTHPLASLDSITAELGDRAQLELVVDHQERRTMSVRTATE